MDLTEWQYKIDQLASQMDGMKAEMMRLGTEASAQMMSAAQHVPIAPQGSFFWDALTVLILAGFVGYYVVWNVTPALHAPLMGITNAISSVIIVGALIAAGPATGSFSKWLGFAGVVLASINIFGGFVVTNRMLEMFTSRKKK